MIKAPYGNCPAPLTAVHFGDQPASFLGVQPCRRVPLRHPGSVRGPLPGLSHSDLSLGIDAAVDRRVVARDGPKESTQEHAEEHDGASDHDGLLPPMTVDELMD